MKRMYFLIFFVCMLGCKGADNKTDVFMNGELYFYKLNINDSYETVKGKISSDSYQLKEENAISRIAKDYIVESDDAVVVYPSNQIIEEKINMEFLLWYYDKHIISFTKFNIRDEELEMMEKWFKGKVKAEIGARFIDYIYLWNGIEYSFQINKKTNIGVVSVTDIKYFSSEGME